MAMEEGVWFLPVVPLYWNTQQSLVYVPSSGCCPISKGSSWSLAIPFPPFSIVETSTCYSPTAVETEILGVWTPAHCQIPPYCNFYYSCCLWAMSVGELAGVSQLPGLLTGSGADHIFSQSSSIIREFQNCLPLTAQQRGCGQGVEFFLGDLLLYVVVSANSLFRVGKPAASSLLLLPKSVPMASTVALGSQNVGFEAPKTFFSIYFLYWEIQSSILKLRN